MGFNNENNGGGYQNTNLIPVLTFLQVVCFPARSSRIPFKFRPEKWIRICEQRTNTIFSTSTQHGPNTCHDH